LPLDDGVYQVGLTAADTYGNTQNYAFTFTIDTQPPAKPIITGAAVDSGTIQARPVLNTSSQFVVELTGTRESQAIVWINGVQKTAGAGTEWSSQVTLIPGSNSTEVYLTDLAGNLSDSEWVDIEMIPGIEVTYHYDSAGRLRSIRNTPGAQ